MISSPFLFFNFMKNRRDGFYIVIKTVKKTKEMSLSHIISNIHSKMAFKVTDRTTSFHLENYS